MLPGEYKVRGGVLSCVRNVMEGGMDLTPIGNGIIPRETAGNVSLHSTQRRLGRGIEPQTGKRHFYKQAPVGG